MGLLKGIDPLLTPELLYALRKAGHGDCIAICDCNFPAHSVAQNNVLKEVIQLPGTGLQGALDAILSVLPIDYFVDSPVRIMVPDEGIEVPKVTQELHSSIQSSIGDVKLQAVNRTKFYDDAAQCFAIVQTFERIPYGNVIISKGVVGPDGLDLKPVSNPC